MKLRAKDVTKAIAKSLLAGHRDSLETRAVALMIHAEVLTVRDAVRRYGISARALYSAKSEIEGAILRECEELSSANEIKGESDSQKAFTAQNLSGALEYSRFKT